MLNKNGLNRFGAAALVSVVFLIGACSQQGDGAKNTQATKEAVAPATAAASSSAAAEAVGRNFVVVGVDDQSIPMSFWNAETNVISGYDIDLAKEALKRAGLKYEFKPIVWDEKEDDLLKEKKIDLIWSSLTINDERKKIFAFSTPYIKNRQGIIVRADSSIYGKADLRGKTVAVQKGSNGAELVRQLKGDVAPAKVDDSYEQKADQLSAVLAGKADAAVTDSVLLDYFSASSPGKFRVLKESLQEEEFGVAVRPSDTELLEKINKALAEMEADGTSQDIYKRWFGDVK